MKIKVIRGGRTVLAVAAAILFFALTAAVRVSGAYAVVTGAAVRELPIYCVGREDKKIAISFDCAWGVDSTDKILEILERENARATFFMVEFWAKKYPQYVKRIDEKGNEIGTHSATHSYMSKLSEEKIRSELDSSSRAISSVTGKKVELFRAPYVDYNDRLIRTARDAGYYTIQWDVDSLDWKDLSANEIAMRVISRVKSGSIILCHNNGKHTAEALPVILDTLKNRGFSFVPIGELILRDHYTIDASGKQTAVG